MSDIPLAIGVDFGATSVKFAVVYRGNIIDEVPPLPTAQYPDPEALILAIVEQIQILRGRHPRVMAVGVGMPGFVDYELGIVHNLTNVPGWTSIPLKARLVEELELPCIVENDANAMAYAEWKRGAGKGMCNLIALTLGTGVGGGVIVDCKLVRGARSGAGEIGQMTIDYKGKKGEYNNAGALEDYVGNREIAEFAMSLYSASGSPISAEKCTPLELARAANQGDPIAMRLWSEVAEKLASVVASCCWLLNPQGVIIGGGVAKAGAVLFDPLQRRTLAQLSGPFRERLQILPARFGNEAGMIGAASLALEEAGYSVDD